MECKSDNSDTKADTGTGFNRYIVECKLQCNLRITDGAMRFNRYIVECKSDSSDCKSTTI